jgi:membrane protein implicated in regulation of membrane protease activity
MAVWQIWIVAGIALFIWEIFTPGFFVASIGIGAFVASICAALGFSFTLQIIALAVGLTLSMILIRPLLYKKGKKSGMAQLTGVDALIGKDASVLQQIENTCSLGRVRIGGEDWKAMSSNGEVIAKDTLVTVDRIVGATAYVSIKEEN